MKIGLYGAPPPALTESVGPAIQYSPLMPGAEALESVPAAQLTAMTILAPPGTIERRYVLAQSLRVLAPGGRLIALAPKDRGGARLGKELAAFGCAVVETGKRHYRICVCTRPGAPQGLEPAISEGGPRFSDALGLWTQAGVFSWDHIDPGSALLAQHLPALTGDGADLGCGLGYLARIALQSKAVRSLILIDLDHRAIEASRRNVEDARAQFLWADARAAHPSLQHLDFVVMNPPFHDGGREDKALGQAFIAAAAAMLKTGGVLWMVANRHLPYEAATDALFRRVELKAETGLYKVLEARK